MTYTPLTIEDVKNRIASKKTYTREDIQNLVNLTINSCNTYDELKDSIRQVITDSGAKIETVSNLDTPRTDLSIRDKTFGALSDLRSYRPVNKRFFGGR